MWTRTPTPPAKLGVRGIPALFIFKGGKIVANRAGAAPKSSLQAWVDQAI